MQSSQRVPSAIAVVAALLVTSTVLEVAAAIPFTDVGTVGTSLSGPEDLLYWRPTSGTSGIEESLLIADTGNHRIARMQLSDNALSNLAGTNGVSGTQATRFNLPSSLALDNLRDVLMVSDTGNNCIRSVDLVTGTIARLTPVCNVNNAFTATRFSAPQRIALDARNKHLFVADQYNNCVRLVDYTDGGSISVYGGACAVVADFDGMTDTDGDRLTTARFVSPYALALKDADDDGGATLYVGQSEGSHTVRSINMDTGVVGTLNPGTYVQNYLRSVHLISPYAQERLLIVDGTLGTFVRRVSDLGNEQSIDGSEFTTAAARVPVSALSNAQHLYILSNESAVSSVLQRSNNPLAKDIENGIAATRTQSVSTTHTVSLSASQSATPSTSGGTVTLSPRTESGTVSVSATAGTTTQSVTVSAPPTRTATPSSTASIGPTATPDPTRTRTDSPTASATASATATVSGSGSASRSFPTGTTTRTVSHSVSVTPSIGTASITLSASPSTTMTVSVPPTRTASATVTQTASDATISLSRSVSLTSVTYQVPPTVSDDVTESATRLPTPTATFSATHTFTASPSPTASVSLTFSGTHTSSRSLSPSASVSQTISASPSTSVSGSVTASHSLSASTSPSATASISRPTLSHTQTHPITRSDEVTGSDSISESLTQSFSLSESDSASFSRTGSATGSVSRSGSATLSRSTSESWSGSASESDSEPLTTSAVPPTTTPAPTPTWSLRIRCTPCEQGVCNEAYPAFCICFSDPVKGYWTGDNLLHGSPCDKCLPGVYGSACKLPCPGGLCNPCSQHGQCFDGTEGNGTCACDASELTGYWFGNDCSVCAPGYFGDSCTIPCNCTSHGRCNIDERQGVFTCDCVEGWAGTYCEDCGYGRFGAECRQCPNVLSKNQPDGSPGFTVCNGHGLCDSGVDGTGKCQCIFPYRDTISGGFCSFPCATAGCGECVDCLRCPSDSGGEPCSGRGNCTDAGVCQCHDRFVGPSCNVSCPVNNATGLTCSGHGRCRQDAECECYASNQTGYWGGSVCDRCDPGYSGAMCDKACPLDGTVVCAGSGTCVDGACECRTLSSGVPTCGLACERIGPDCDPCPKTADGRNRFGDRCLGICQCAHGTCSSGKLGDGTCACPTGYVGILCEIECDGGHTNPCNLKGRCLADGTCECEPFVGGPACNSSCAFGIPAVTDPVNDPDPAPVACSAHGQCLSGARSTGRCLCSDSSTEGHWAGDSCSVCRAGFAGPSCSYTCVEGTTVNRTCVCDALFGGPSCDRRCPFNNESWTAPGMLGLCSNQGDCDDGSTGTGTCICNAGYEGPMCNCTQSACLQVLPNSRCSPTSGQCICDEFHSGEGCLDCSVAYWGFDCREPCACRSISNGTLGDLHGTCARATGDCTCFRDDERGYWTGTFCTSCVDGFFGSECRQKTVVSSQISSLVVDQSASIFKYRTDSIVPDDDFRFVYVTGDVIAVFNTSVTAEAKLRLFVRTSDIFNCTTGVAATWLVGFNIFFAVPPRGGCREDLEVYSWPRFREGIATDVVPVPKKQGHATLRGSHRHSYFVFAWLKLAVVSVELETGFFYLEFMTAVDGEYVGNATDVGEPIRINEFTSVSGMVYFAVNDILIVYGSASFINAYTCHAVAIDRQGNKQTLTGLSENDGFPMWLAPDTCTSFEAAYTVRSIVLFGVSNSKGPGITTMLPLWVSRQRPQVIATTLPPSHVPTAISADADSGMTLMSACRPTLLGADCRLVKFNVLSSSSVELNGLQVVGRTESIADMSTSRFLITYVLFTRYPGILVRRILMWEVVDIYPPIADVEGRTPVTVIGRGFKPGNVRCSFTPKESLSNNNAREVEGRYINTTAVECIAPPTEVRSVCEKRESVEVSLDGGVAYTSNGVTLDRVQTPIVKTVSPVRQFASPSVVRPPEGTKTVELTGTDFVSSPTARCLFDASNGNVSTRALITTLTTATCFAPYIVYALAPDAVVRLSLDGTIFSTDPVAYLIVGDARGIAFSVPYAIVATAGEAVVPGLSLAVVDAEGNSLQSFAMSPYPIELAVRQPYRVNYTTVFDAVERNGTGFTAAQAAEIRSLEEAQDARFASQRLAGDLGQATTGGIATFEKAFFAKPVATTTTRLVAMDLYVSRLQNGSRTGSGAATSPGASAGSGTDSGSSSSSVPSDADTGGTSPASGTADDTGGAVSRKIEEWYSWDPASYRAQSGTDLLPFFVILSATSVIPPEAGGGSWTAAIPVMIVVGEPDHLGISVQPPERLNIRGDFSKTPVVFVADVGNNPITYANGPLDGVEIRATTIAEAPVGVQLADVKDRPNPNRTTIFTSGRAEFRSIALNARHGFLYRFLFSVPEFPAIVPVLSDPVRSNCPAVTWMVSGEYECSTCLENAVCDGQNISVSPGWWRGSDLSSSLYQCSPESVCPGGSAAATCLDNYRGPVCQLCVEGYSKGIRDRCEECFPSAVNVAFLTLLLVCITGLISVFVVYTVQNADRINNLAIVVQLFVSHWQTVAILPFLDNPWPAYFLSLTKWVDAFADFRVMDTNFGECLLSVGGFDFKAKFVFQIVLGCLTFVAVGVSRALLFLFPKLFKRTSTRDRVRPTLPITNTRVFITSVLVGVFFLYQGTLFYALGMLNCRTFNFGPGDNQRLLIADVSVDCDDPAYASIRYAAWPISLFLLFGIPFALVACYWTHAFVRPKARNFRYQCGAFLLGGLTKSAWYWPAVVTVRKGTLVAIVVLLDWPSDAQTAGWVLVLYLLALIYVRPYQRRAHQSIETLGTSVALVSVNLATMYHTAGTLTWLPEAISPVVIALEAVATFAFLLLMSRKLKAKVLEIAGMRERPPERERDEDFIGEEGDIDVGDGREAIGVVRGSSSEGGGSSLSRFGDDDEFVEMEERGGDLTGRLLPPSDGSVDQQHQSPRQRGGRGYVPPLREAADDTTFAVKEWQDSDGDDPVAPIAYHDDDDGGGGGDYNYRSRLIHGGRDLSTDASSSLAVIEHRRRMREEAEKRRSAGVARSLAAQGNMDAARTASASLRGGGGVPPRHGGSNGTGSTPQGRVASDGGTTRSAESLQGDAASPYGSPRAHPAASPRTSAVATALRERVAEREAIARTPAGPPQFASVDLDVGLASANVDTQARDLERRVRAQRRERRRALADMQAAVMGDDAIAVQEAATAAANRRRARKAAAKRGSGATSVGDAVGRPRRAIDPDTL